MGQGIARVEPCKRAPMNNGRCSNHRGKSLKGFAHPNYKHGCYLKYDVMGIWISYELQIRALKRRLSQYEREPRATVRI